MSRTTLAGYLAQLVNLARAKGGVLLSRAYLGDATKLRWRCAEGHVFMQRPTSVKQGKWCRLCGWAHAGATRRAKGAARLRRVIARRGGAMLSDYLGAGRPLRFRCARGHEWATVPSSVLAGTWCRRCSNETRFAKLRDRVLRRLQKVARRHGGEVVGWRSGRYARYLLCCARGHRWHSRAATVNRGAWCQACERASYFERLRKAARRHGGVLLSRTYVNEDTPLRFRCAAGHRFVQRAADTARGHWCPECSALRRAEKRKAPARARLCQIVAERGGTVLSPAYVNSQTRMQFRCARGHEWETVPNQIATGAWCRRCGIEERARHPERHTGRPAKIWAEVRERLERIVRARGGEIVPPGYARFHSRITVRCEQGHTWTAPPQSLQDGVWCPRCGAEALMSTFRELAERWGGECLSESCRSRKEILQWRCAAGHRFRKSGEVVKRGSWCPACRGLSPGDLERMRQVARERGGECLSERYVDAGTKLRWRCGEGHEWSATPGMIVRGHWCPACRWQRSYSRARLSIEDMRRTAGERGGRCLSDAYHGSKVRLRWRCARGHMWMAHPNRVRQGSWCPSCAHTSRGTLESMRALAVEYSGRCLSRTWNNHLRPLRFECARGHRFHALGGVVKTGVWCPRCAPPGRASAGVR